MATAKMVRVAIITKIIIKNLDLLKVFLFVIFERKMKKYEILEHPADLKIRAFGKDKKELFWNMLNGLQDSLKPNLKSQISNFKIIRVESSSLETLLVDFLSEVLYLIQVDKEIYDKIKFLKFSDNEIEAEISGKAVESFGEDIKGATYHDLEIKRNPDKTWQATVLFDI